MAAAFPCHFTLAVFTRTKELCTYLVLLFTGPFLSGPMWAYILAHENAVPLWRSLMGPTKVFRARNSVPDSIRGAYGLTDTRNTTHGSGRPVVGRGLGRAWGSGRCEWCCLVCFYFPSWELPWMICPLVQTPLTAALTQPSLALFCAASALPFGTQLVVTVPHWHPLSFALFSNRLTSIGQQRNCLLLPRVQRAALVPAGGAAPALRAGVLQRGGACPLCAGGWGH